MNVNPTRMELSKFKKQLKTSVEAHKLLKDKQDEIMLKFIALLRDTKETRSEFNAKIAKIKATAGLSVAEYPYRMMKNTFLTKETLISAEISPDNWMGLSVVDIKYDIAETKPSSALVSSPSLTKTEHDMKGLLPLLLKLTVSEKNCYIMSKEIETLRRRVNALEYMVIPDLEKNIRMIKMKLGDSERETVTRLIKVKDMK